MMELYLLEQLIAFSRQGTLSGAAEELHISQPALSQSMKKLEESLGVSLFERSKNKIALNENGIMAVQLGEKLLEQSREMEEGAAPRCLSGTWCRCSPGSILK